MNSRFCKILNILEKIPTDDVDIESPLVSLAFRHYKLELNKSTPFTWDIIPKNNNETVTVIITVDKKALEEEVEVEELILKTLKDNVVFKEMVRAFSSFKSGGKDVENLYNFKSWKKNESANLIKYVKTIYFGEGENG